LLQIVTIRRTGQSLNAAAVDNRPSESRV
jgi:hypothetical protein